jgi:hypothetical protein
MTLDLYAAHQTKTIQSGLVAALDRAKFMRKSYGVKVVSKSGKPLEDSGLEPLTSCLQSTRSTN